MRQIKMAGDQWNGRLRQKIPDLVKALRPVSSGLLDTLYAEHLINREELFKLKNLDNEEERSRELLTTDLPSKGPQSFDRFCDQLERCAEQRHLVDIVQGGARNAIPTEADVKTAEPATSPEAQRASYDQKSQLESVPAAELTIRFGYMKAPQPKRITFYVPPPCHDAFKEIELIVKSACSTTGISKANVKVVYEDVDEEVQAVHEGAYAVVCDEVMLVSLVIYGASADELEAKVDDAFIRQLLSSHLAIPPEEIIVKERLNSSCSIIISVSFSAVAALFNVLRDPGKVFAFASSLQLQVPELTHAEVMLGNLYLPIPFLKPRSTEELVAASPQSTAQEHLQLILASQLSETDRAEVLRAACAKVSEKPEPERSLWKANYLFYAAGAGQVEMCDVLLEHGADARNSVESDEGTRLSAIHAAAQGDHVDVIRSLLKAKIPVNLQDDDENSALMWASWYGNYNTVEFLLKEKANPQAVNMYGYTPLHYAAASGSLKSISLLCDAEADKEAVTNSLNLTPLHVAIQKNQVAAVQSLLNLKAHPVACTSLGLQPIHLAAWSANHRCLRLLIAEGVGSRDDSILGPPMKLAEIQGHVPEVVDTVLDAMEEREKKKANIVKDLEDTLDGISKDVDHLNNRCTQLTDDSKTLQNEVKELSDELKKQEEEAEDNKKKAAELEKTLSDEQERLTKEVEEEKKKFEKLQEEVKEFEKQHDELEKKIADLEQTALGMQEDIEKLEKTVGTGATTTIGDMPEESVDTSTPEGQAPTAPAAVAATDTVAAAEALGEDSS
jgi:hypothetical protein